MDEKQRQRRVEELLAAFSDPTKPELSGKLMTAEERAIQQHQRKPEPRIRICGCLGPQNDEPLCPCRMQWCERVGNDWYQIDRTRDADGNTQYSARKL